jgi:DNA primase large subunit
LNIDIKDLTMAGFEDVLNRAEERIKEAMVSGTVERHPLKDRVEIASFPIAILLVASSSDSFMKRRYALAEAKRSSNLLEHENLDEIVRIAKNFSWKLEKPTLGHEASAYDFMLYFVDFLRNAAAMQDAKWKLVNRLVFNGYVYLTRIEASRLLEDEIRRHIERKLDTKVGQLPPDISARVEGLKQLSAEKKGEEMPRGFPEEIVEAAFPPCINMLYASFKSGHHLSHTGRFALTSFLTSVGMSPENVVELFRTVSDFNEKMTRYQVEHIAGEKGSRTRYIPPKCGTLRTHGLCISPDEICRNSRIRHPLGYYRVKLRMAEAKASHDRA